MMEQNSLVQVWLEKLGKEAEKRMQFWRANNSKCGYVAAFCKGKGGSW